MGGDRPVNPAMLRELLNSDDPQKVLDAEGFLRARRPQPAPGAPISTGQGLLEGAVDAADLVPTDDGESPKGTAFKIDPGDALGALAFLSVMIGNGRRVALKPGSKHGVRCTVSDRNFDGPNVIAAVMLAAAHFADEEGALG